MVTPYHKKKETSSDTHIVSSMFLFFLSTAKKLEIHAEVEIEGAVAA